MEASKDSESSSRCVDARTRGFAASALALAILLTACGSGDSGSGDSGSAAPKTVRIESSDAGKTISLHVGDLVVLDLGPPQNATWILTAYPKDALAVASSSPGVGRFEFTATGRGTGQIVVVMKLSEPESSPGGAGNDFPLRPFRVTVEVS